MEAAIILHNAKIPTNSFPSFPQAAAITDEKIVTAELHPSAGRPRLRFDSPGDSCRRAGAGSFVDIVGLIPVHGKLGEPFLMKNLVL